MNIRIIKPGMFTTIQDRGRFGYEAFGIPNSGVLDARAAALANHLVGNPANEAVIEITITGPTIEFDAHCGIAITGADISPLLNGTPIHNNTAYEVENGYTLSFGAIKTGCRAYLAISGVIDVPLIYGSKSTYSYAQLGGFKGRPLQKGDRIPLKEKALPIGRLKETIPVTQYPSSVTLEVIKGPEFHLFNQKDIETFLHSTFGVTPESNRMGLRLKGNAIDNSNLETIISSGIIPGTIQIPPSGQPMLLLHDSGTTGGYPRIANCRVEELSVLAQLKSGDELRFTIKS